MLHEESRPFLPIPGLDMAEEGIEELVRRIIRSTQEGVDTSRANVALDVSTPEEELRRRFIKERDGLDQKESRTGSRRSAGEISPQARRTINKQAS